MRKIDGFAQFENLNKILFPMKRGANEIRKKKKREERQNEQKRRMEKENRRGN